MPGRTVPLVNNCYYHIYNRGNNLRNIFIQNRDYQRCLKTIYYYQFQGPKPSYSNFTKADFKIFKPNPKDRLVEIVCFCLMPNHFHFLLKQSKEDGISTFISQFCNSYTKFFNTKYGNIGALLQGVFKSVAVETNEQLLHLSRYIHLNPVVSLIANDPLAYQWSSYAEFMTTPYICDSRIVLGQFSSVRKYDQFVKDQIDYGTMIEVIKHQTIDLDE